VVPGGRFLSLHFGEKRRGRAMLNRREKRGERPSNSRKIRQFGKKEGEKEKREKKEGKK